MSMSKRRRRRMRGKGLLIPNAKTIAAMEEARLSGLESFISVDDLMADLALHTCEIDFDTLKMQAEEFPAGLRERIVSLTAGMVVDLDAEIVGDVEMIATRIGGEFHVDRGS